jgi:uncharacterized membrane protein YhaH (DUF805 family)
MDVSPFFIYGLPVLTVLVLGLLGRTRRLGFWPTVLLSLLVTPVVGLMGALISGPRHRRARGQ